MMGKKDDVVARVSDHAMVRYLERAKGFNFDRVREKLRRAAQAQIDSGAARVTIDGVELRVLDGVVMTVVNDRRFKRPRRPGPTVDVEVD
jgi:hypothetical protein